jgi:hypothetical protein
MTSRPRPSIRTIPSILPGLCLSALLLASGCDGRSGVLAPDRAATAAQAAPAGVRALLARGGTADQAPQFGVYKRIWPHEDGRSWTYRDVSRTWPEWTPAYYPTPGEVPTLSLDRAKVLLESEPVGSDPDVATGTYGLRFNGQIATRSGATGQNLEESLTESGSPAAAKAAGIARPDERFLGLLRRARPDLGPKLADRGGAPAVASGAASLPWPTLLHGYAWEQNRDWIGTYGDLNRSVAWIFLTSGIRPGSEFSIQLVPDLANDVYLRVRVLGWRTVETDAGVFRRALHVLYLVDFGLSRATGIDGDPLGYTRSYLAGTIDYVPGVGPVHSLERLWLYFDGGASGATGDITLSLTGSAEGAAAVAQR